MTEDLAKLSKVISSVKTPEQYEVARKYARLMYNKLNGIYGDDWKFSFKFLYDIQKDLRTKGREIGLTAPRTI